MFEFLVAPANLPFSVALGLLIAFFVIELAGLLLGTDVGGALGDVDVPDIDIDAGFDPGVATKFLYWLKIGRVPLLILIVVFMTAFVICGYALQFAIRGLAGFLLPAPIAAAAALAMSIPLVRLIGGPLGRVIPHDETSAVSQAELVGTRAVIVLGVARAGSPAQARVTDRFGATHYLMLEPDDPEAVLETGRDLLIVRFDGVRYFAIPHPEP